MTDKTAWLFVQGYCDEIKVTYCIIHCHALCWRGKANWNTWM